MLFEIGGVAKKLPPYRGTRMALAFDAPLLHDCLNEHYPFWEDGFIDRDDPNCKDEDYSNDPDMVLDIQNTNRTIRELFDEFIEADTKERLRSSGKLSVGYEVYAGKLCEVNEFDSLGAFLFSDFFRGLQNNYIPKRCDNCEDWFLLTGKYLNYCDRPLKDDRNKTCRDVGSRRRYDDKCRNDPIWLAYNRAYKAHYARYLKKKMTTAQFEQWSRWAVELRDKAERGEVALEEYQREIRV